ncbi:hypothetical protein GHT06_017990 [Daphnia sinensis]|uniref:Secreted protein n=1 Tax=Daphnia sinensis TaxID=1820382 RepID=A0AAD5L3E3_9CRUS|nr:hypothetical protein GHT06_017990 [Daphnia sinensis]
MFGFLYTQISQSVGLLLLTFVSVRVDWMEIVHHPEVPFGFSKYFADGQHRCVIQANTFRQQRRQNMYYYALNSITDNRYTKFTKRCTFSFNIYQIS